MSHELYIIISSFYSLFFENHYVHILKKKKIPILSKKINLPLDSKYIAHDLSFVTIQFPLFTKLPQF
jgi:hypothetical protein